MEQETEQRRASEAMAADSARLAQALRAAGTITGVGSSPDGAVTVEVGMGGTLRAVRIDPDALRGGAARVSRAVLAAAEQARARANREASRVCAEVLGPRANKHLAAVGLGFDPKLAESDVDGDFPEEDSGYRAERS